LKLVQNCSVSSHASGELDTFMFFICVFYACHNVVNEVQSTEPFDRLTDDGIGIWRSFWRRIFLHFWDGVGAVRENYIQVYLSVIIYCRRTVSSVQLCIFSALHFGSFLTKWFFLLNLVNILHTYRQCELLCENYFYVAEKLSTEHCRPTCEIRMSQQSVAYARTSL